VQATYPVMQQLPQLAATPRHAHGAREADEEAGCHVRGGLLCCPCEAMHTCGGKRQARRDDIPLQRGNLLQTTWHIDDRHASVTPFARTA